MKKINWQPEGDGIGTSFVAFYESPWSFEETIARLLTVIGGEEAQDVFSGDEPKVSFEIHGEFQGNWFSLYDYKEDDQIHIGGNFTKEDADEILIPQLTEELSTVEPTSFRARTYYGEDRKYGWPNDVCFECGQKLPGKE